MRVMCLNGWGGKMHDVLLPYVAEAAPDILCLQEVVHSPESSKDWLVYRDGAHVLDQRANFLRDVCRSLPDHVAVFCPAARGVLWDGDVSVPSFWGLATFVHRSLPIIGQAQGFVHGIYGADGFGAHPRSRSAHGVRVFDHGRGRAVSVTQMHGLRDLAGKHDTPARADQARKLLELAGQVAHAGAFSVICGDFNVEPESETLRILGAAGYSELVTGRGFSGTRTSLYPKAGRFADYMLVNDPSGVAAFDVVRAPEVSDHCPLVLELSA